MSSPSDLPSRELVRDTEWSLLYDGPGRVAAPKVWVAQGAAIFREQWAATTRLTSFPQVDFERMIAITFHRFVPHNCPLVPLLGLRWDASQRLLYGHYAPVRGCDSEIAGSHSFVVVVDRRSLPTGEVRVMLEGDSEGPDYGNDKEITINL